MPVWSGTRQALAFFSRVTTFHARALCILGAAFVLVVTANWTMGGSPYTACRSRIASEADAARFARDQLTAKYPNFPLDPRHGPGEQWIGMNGLGQFGPVGWRSSSRFDGWLMQRVWQVEYRSEPDRGLFYAEFSECGALREAALA